MSLFDKVTSMLGGTEGEQGGLISNVMKMMTDQQAGGRAGLVKSFEEKGLNDIISSWVGTGENKAITPDQLQHGFGLERLQQLAEGSGLSVDDVKAKLAEVLPGLIDKLTPEGKLPEAVFLPRPWIFSRVRLEKQTCVDRKVPGLGAEKDPWRRQLFRDHQPSLRTQMLD